MVRPSTLRTHPNQLVLSALRKSKKPLTAYHLLEKLGPSGVRSPPIIYRALDALREQGTVHRIEAQNAYVACDCTAGHTHTLSVLAICQTCQRVQELHDHAIIDHLLKLRRLKVNLAEGSVIELPTLCEKCT